MCPGVFLRSQSRNDLLDPPRLSSLLDSYLSVAAPDAFCRAKTEIFGMTAAYRGRKILASSSSGGFFVETTIAPQSLMNEPVWCARDHDLLLSATKILGHAFDTNPLSLTNCRAPILFLLGLCVACSHQCPMAVISPSFYKFVQV